MTRLSEDTKMFGGEVFVGQQALAAGLADDIGHLAPAMKNLYGDKIRFSRHGPKKSPFAFLGARIVDDALAAAEDRLAYARFGL